MASAADNWIRITVTLPPEKHAEYKRLAFERGLSMSSYMRTVLYGHLRDRSATFPPITTGTNTL